MQEFHPIPKSYAYPYIVLSVLVTIWAARNAYMESDLFNKIFMFLTAAVIPLIPLSAHRLSKSLIRVSAGEIDYCIYHWIGISKGRIDATNLTKVQIYSHPAGYMQYFSGNPIVNKRYDFYMADGTSHSINIMEQSQNHVLNNLLTQAFPRIVIENI